MTSYELQTYRWTIGIYRGTNKFAHLYNVTLAEARSFLKRKLEEGDWWSIYCMDERHEYTHEQISELLNLLPDMNPIYKQLHCELQEARKRLAQCKNSYERKKKDLIKTIQEDTPDLFGERKSQQLTKLFDERVEPKNVTVALEPYKIAMMNAEAEVNRLEKQLIRLEENPMPELFAQAG